jgi:hypothetical protein
VGESGFSSFSVYLLLVCFGSLAGAPYCVYAWRGVCLFGLLDWYVCIAGVGGSHVKGGGDDDTLDAEFPTHNQTYLLLVLLLGDLKVRHV